MASQIALKSGTNNTGVLSFNGTSDTTLSLPNESGTLATKEYIPTALNASGSAPMYACRAWVNFNGTGTVAIRASGNVSSITDNGVGNYTVNFITAMPDANYSAGGYTRYNTTSGSGGYIRDSNSATSRTVSSNMILVVNGANGDVAFDAEIVSVSYFR